MMAEGVRTPRSRGSLCGLALILLGGWGGLAPIAGPSFGFGFTPDRAWHLTAGRLYLSALPGAVVVLAGLVVLVTRSRWFGGFCALAAAVAGAWFIAGAALAKLLPAQAAQSIVTGSVIGSGTSRAVFTSLACFAGTGALIVFFAALALGRFSMAAGQDALAEDVTFGGAAASAAGLAASGLYGGYQPPQDRSPLASGTFPPASQTTTEQYPVSPAGQPGQYPSPEPFGGTGGQYPPHDPFGLTQDVPGPRHPPSQSPFPPAPNPFPPAEDPTRPKDPGTQAP